MLDDTPKDYVQAVPHDVQQQQRKIPHTAVNVRQSTRKIRPLEGFLPLCIQFYLLMLVNLNVMMKLCRWIQRFSGSLQ